MGEHICGKCMMPIHEAETGLRHFGHFTAHSENRCLAILRDSLAAAQRERDEARSKAGVTANMVGGIQVEDGDKYGGADNLAIVLATYFEHHAEAKARKAMQIIADEINKAREIP